MTAVPEPGAPPNGKGIPPKRCAQEGCGVPEYLVLEDPDGLHPDACFSHAPWLEAERRLARTKGGLKVLAKARKWTYLVGGDLGALRTAADAERRAQIICDAVATGQLASSAGAVALKALDSWLRAHEAVDLDARLAALERRAAEDEARRAKEQAARAAESRRAGYLTTSAPKGNGA